jgi:Calcium binding
MGASRKREPDTKLKLFSKAKLEKLIEEAVVDAYGKEEQVGGFFTMMEEHLALPFSANILGVDVVVEKVDMIRSGRIVAICRRNKIRQKIEILDLPLPTPAPAGAEWIAAYHHWRRGF